jgi:hypothetical protein
MIAGGTPREKFFSARYPLRENPAVAKMPIK